MLKPKEDTITRDRRYIWEGRRYGAGGEDMEVAVTDISRRYGSVVVSRVPSIRFRFEEVARIKIELPVRISEAMHH